jgi:hypothetical protein
MNGPEAMSGKLLLLLACAEKHHARDLASISLNRLMRALEEPGHTIRWMKDAWVKTRGAHLWAGLLAALADELRTQALSADAVERVLRQSEGRARVLGYAAWFTEWGQAFTPKGSSHPVLWRHSLVPVQVAPLEPNLPVLPADLLRAMAAYRAPKEM